uniref:Uncharacterized protein n=1 Tax=Pleurostichidium falkenbergii TaxID=121064 RepID=A0A4D6UXD1_9FLOR|nr:hypothetical protein [Pleurostichidium falkenbergii]QCH39566.1 hypothetical protein [Pleurostichidium falkenbergii]
MNNNLFLIRFYLLIIILFLLFFSMLVSKQLFVLFRNNLRYIVLFKQIKTKLNLNESKYVSLLLLCSSRANFFLSIALLEFFLQCKSNLIKKDLLYASLAYCYYKNFFYSIAEYYYLKILVLFPYNIDAILNLGYMYYDLDYKVKSKLMFDRAVKLKPCISIPSKYIF